MNIRPAVIIFAAGIMIVSCSEKPAPDQTTDANTSPAARELVRESKAETAEREDQRQPSEEKVAEDCVAFVRSTKVVPAKAANADCPGCPAGGRNVLTFRHVKTETASCSADTCTLLVTIRAVFEPGSGETIAGGLTAWIPPEQRTAYLSGHTPAGEQEYRVQITYKRHGAGWRVLEFDRPAAE